MPRESGLLDDSKSGLIWATYKSMSEEATYFGLLCHFFISVYIIIGFHCEVLLIAVLYCKYKEL